MSCTERTGARVDVVDCSWKRGRRLTGTQLDGRESSMTVAPTSNSDTISVCLVGFRQEECLKGKRSGVRSRNREDVVCLLRSSEETKQKDISVIYEFQFVNCEPYHSRFLVGNNVKEPHCSLSIGSWPVSGSKAAMPFEEWYVLGGNHSRNSPKRLTRPAYLEEV